MAQHGSRGHPVARDPAEGIIEHLRRVVRSQPENIDARLSLATHLRRLRRAEDALRHLEIVARLQPGFAAVYNNMGNICRDLRRPEEAEEYLLKAVELQPDFPEALNNLGALYSEQGRAGEALERFRSAIACRPDYCKAHRNLATTKKHERYDDEFHAMLQLFDRPGASDFDRMQLGFGLGKACEELGDHRKAFEFWSVANRCQRNVSPYVVEAAVAEMAAMRQIFDQERLLDADGARGEQTPIFIVGMPRSGTSLVEQILASHSAVHGAGELELIDQLARTAVDRYPEALAELSPFDWRRLGSEYLGAIERSSSGERFVVDKLPLNFQNVGMIRMMFADTRIIHCRRDPLDTGLSCFKNHFLGSRLDFSCDLDDLGVYLKHHEALMDHWHHVLPGRLIDVSYEHLVADPDAEIRALLEHCGLPFEPACLAFHETQRMVATASMGQVKRPIHRRSVRKWRQFERELEPLSQALDRTVDS